MKKEEIHIDEDILQEKEEEELAASEKEAIKRYVELGGPVEGRMKFIVGYSGWGKGQIASELKRHDWAVLNQGDRNLLMGDGDDDQWRDAVARFGNRYRLWLNMPSDPTNN